MRQVHGCDETLVFKSRGQVFRKLFQQLRVT